MAGLDMWTVYAPGTDGQGQYVARCWHVEGGEATPTGHTMHAMTLELMRALLTRMVGCDTVFPRQDGDEFNIVETWV